MPIGGYGYRGRIGKPQREDYMTPAARTLKLLRASGYLVDVVERRIPKIEIRRDLFGFGDVLAVHPVEKRFLIVQATSRPNVGARLKKAQALASLAIWLRAGCAREIEPRAPERVDPALSFLPGRTIADEIEGVSRWLGRVHADDDSPCPFSLPLPRCLMDNVDVPKTEIERVSLMAKMSFDIFIEAFKIPPLAAKAKVRATARQALQGRFIFAEQFARGTIGAGAEEEIVTPVGMWLLLMSHYDVDPHDVEVEVRWLGWIEERLSTL